MPRILRRTLLPAAALAAALAVPAAAHLGNPDYRSVVREIVPATEGLSAQVIDHDDALLVINHSREDVVILGADGRPFARLLADGTVQVDARSSAANGAGDAGTDEGAGEADGATPRDGQAGASIGTGAVSRAGAAAISDVAPAGIAAAAGDGALLAHAGHDHGDEPARPRRAGRRSGAAGPRWVVLDRTGRFQWHEDRIKYRESAVPPQVTDRAQRTKVMDWRVPITVGGERGAILGTLWWVGEPGAGSSFPTAAVVSLVVLAAAAVAAVVLVRRRRDAG